MVKNFAASPRVHAHKSRLVVLDRSRSALSRAFFASEPLGSDADLVILQPR